MEFPHLGRNCAFRTCNTLDFLPFQCATCLEWFCNDHFAYANHECSEHIDVGNPCQPDPADQKRPKVYTNRCSYKGCKTKEVMPLVCNVCELNFCLEHRHGFDHACEGALAAKRSKAALNECPAQNSKDEQLPNGGHIENQGQPDPAKERRQKIYTNHCSYKGCKTKEMTPQVCNECELNFCLEHAADHACEGELAAKRRKAAEAAMKRLQSGQSKKLEFKTRIGSNPVRARVATLHDVQHNRNADEALDTALSMSLRGASLIGSDVAIARSLARGMGALASSSSSQSRPYRPPRRYNTGTSGSDLQLNMFDILKVVGGIVLTLYVLANLKRLFGSNSSSSSKYDDTYLYDNGGTYYY